MGWPPAGWRWAGATLLAAGLGLPGAHAALPLDEAQRAWLQAHPQVRLAVERDYGPFVYQQADGRITGLSIDMLELVRERLGLGVKPLPPAPLQDLLAAARRGDADLITSLRPTPERGEFLLFTRPYVSVPAVVAMRASADDADPLREGVDPLRAFAGRAVAVGAGYAVESVVRQRHPQVLWQPVRDDVVALRGLAEGRYAAAVLDSASLAFVQREHRLPPLRAVGRVGFDYTLSFAVRRDWPQLRDLLDAAILDVPAAERQRVLERWMPQAPPAPEHAPLATRVGLVLLALGVAGGLRVLWRRRGAAS